MATHRSATSRPTDSVESRLTVVDTVLSDVIRQITNAQSRAAAGRSSILTPTQRTAIAGEIRERGRRHPDRDQHAVSRHVSVLGRPVDDAAVHRRAADLALSGRRQRDVDRRRARQAPCRSTFDGGAILQGAAPTDLLQTLTTLANDVQTRQHGRHRRRRSPSSARRSIASPTRRRASASISRSLHRFARRLDTPAPRQRHAPVRRRGRQPRRIDQRHAAGRRGAPGRADRARRRPAGCR